MAIDRYHPEIIGGKVRFFVLPPNNLKLRTMKNKNKDVSLIAYAIVYTFALGLAILSVSAI